MLEIHHLRTEFSTASASVRAVDDISFELKRGEVLGIVGESGSGKSMTALSIMGLVPSPGRVTQGEIYYTNPLGERRDLLKCPADEMRQLRGDDLAMIFQEPMTALNPVFSCGAQVVESIQVHQKLNYQKARQRTLSLFEQVQLREPERIFDSYPHELSGGQ
ncbi:MAG: ATP-binding cassette domain-containing protein, partial [Bacteroidota bacterium]